ncbi:hypothetical protein IQ243_27300 [Nostocales cyanobacterium LEGE 11386]|nr:hypothetical protein [Nostocales cyanobacterium LEGE 11386]
MFIDSILIKPKTPNISQIIPVIPYCSQTFPIIPYFSQILKARKSPKNYRTLRQFWRKVFEPKLMKEQLRLLKLVTLNYFSVTALLSRTILEINFWNYKHCCCIITDL